jgi:hypothetical protein
MHSARAHARLLGCTVIVLGLPRLARSQGSEQRIVLEVETPCRDAPAADARVVRSYRVGQVVDVKQAALRGGTTWYSTETVYIAGVHPLCWMDGGTTASYDQSRPDAALDTLTARMVRPTAHLQFEDLVAVENLLIGPQASALARSGLLQFRRLLIIEKANAALDAMDPAPLEVAWLLAHREYLAQDPFAIASYALAKPYWQLFARYKTALWADDLAWHAAQLREPTDECYSDCVLKVGIIEGPMQYWSRLPHGHSIDAALSAGIKAATYATELACYDQSDRPKTKSDSPMPPELLRRIRSSLSPVTADAKRRLLAILAEGEAKCR